MTVEAVEYHATERLLSFIDRDVADGMVRQALERWRQRGVEMGDGVYACRMMAGRHLVVFFMLDLEGQVRRQLLLWDEAVERNLAPALEQLFKTGDVRDGPAAFLRDFLRDQRGG